MDSTQTEKQINLSVKRFCEKEKKKYREAISVVDSWTSSLKDKSDLIMVKFCGKSWGFQF